MMKRLPRRKGGAVIFWERPVPAASYPKYELYA